MLGRSKWELCRWGRCRTGRFKPGGVGGNIVYGLADDASVKIAYLQ